MEMDQAVVRSTTMHIISCYPEICFSQLQLVFLNGCSTSAAGSLLAMPFKNNRGPIPFIVAWKNTVKDEFAMNVSCLLFEKYLEELTQNPAVDSEERFKKAVKHAKEAGRLPFLKDAAARSDAGPISGSTRHYQFSARFKKGYCDYAWSNSIH